MKVAILISGEYRTFPVCRKTMKFLDDPTVDIYFSTWDSSHHTHPNLGVFHPEKITQDIIKDAMTGKEIVGLLDDSSMFNNHKYNSKMIYKWLSGLELIKASEKKYDAILIIRPDMFFNIATETSEFMFNRIRNIQDGVLYTSWFDTPRRHQDDMAFLATPLTMLNSIGSISIDSWNNSSETEWHRWLWNEFENKKIVRDKFCPQLDFCLCRPIVTLEDVAADECYANVFFKSKVWQYSSIEYSIKRGNEEKVAEVWHKGIFEDLANFWKKHPTHYPYRNIT